MMLRRIRTSASVAATIAAALWLTTADATTQQASNGNAATPRTSDGKVDFSGMWVGGGGGGDLKPDESGNITVLSRGRPCHPG